MKAGYEIEQYGIIPFTTIWLYNWHDKIGLVQWDNTDHELNECLVAIFRIHPKIECDQCGALTKDTQDAAGNTYCQKCEENINEERAERWANDAESTPYNDYSQYKSLK